MLISRAGWLLHVKLQAQERRGYSTCVDYSTVESTTAERTVIVNSL